MSSLFDNNGMISTDTLVENLLKDAEIRELQRQNNELRENVSKLKDEHKNLEELIKNSEESIKILRQDNQQLNTRIENLLKNTEQNKLNENFQRLINEKKKLTQTNNELQDELKFSKEKIVNLLKKLKKINFSDIDFQIK